MNPTKTQIHVDQVLTRVAVAYKNPEYIFMDIAPEIPVAFESGKYYEFTKGDWFRNEAALRAAGEAARQSGFKVSTSSYSADEYALATKLADRDVANADNVLALRTAKAEFVADRVGLAREIELSGAIMTTSVWGTDKSLSATWDSSSSTPIEDILEGIDTIAQSAAKEANTAVMGRQVWTELRRHPDVLDLLSTTERQIATPQLLAQALDLSNIHIGKAIYNTAKEGQTPSYSYVWGKKFLLCYITPTPGLMTPTALYTFVARPMRVRRWRDEEEEAEYIEASIILDFKVVSSDVGWYVDSAVA